MNRLLVFIPLLSLLLSSCNPSGTSSQLPERVTMSKDLLRDKIKGGWAGKTIGCTYGGASEFKFTGCLIPEYVQFDWNDTIIKWWYDYGSWLYDDMYMNATFVAVCDSLGEDAPADAFAEAFANADYSLWHANQAARYNLLTGIKAPESGQWQHNFHANDIDFQIEADFIGLMAPGMINSAVNLCDRVGHIMNYGDGYYGGVFVASMYTLAFISDDIEFVVTEALKTIPAESGFHQCISDVLRFYKQYPDDWKQTWFEVEKRWEEHHFCATYEAYNIEAKINAAYIVIGLLYGQGDFTRTIDIATRCGQDSDCNPSNAAGILGAMFGYSQIPEQYLTALHYVEERDFDYTNISLEDLYDMSFHHALEMIEHYDGTVAEDSVTIAVQQPETIPLEVSFPGLFPTKVIEWRRVQKLTEVKDLAFTGKGILINGNIVGPDGYVAQVELIIDGQVAEQAKLPVNYRERRNELAYTFDIPNGKHTATLKWLNPRSDVKMNIGNIVIYGDDPRKQEE